MAELKIIKDYSKGSLLRKKSRLVEEITPRIITLLDDMRETLIASGGVGLAAPQVGVLRRVALVDNGEEILELINPEILSVEGEQEGLEGCLSYPDKWGIVRRPMKVRVKALNRKGETVEYEGTELTARCFCHEIDHLDGVLFTDNVIRMVDEEEIEKMQRENKKNDT
ncbi:MAG: peptide deformylase [Clostridia bacterium]|nr:peptide deformylase [Clostridia bacterium]